MALDDSLEVDMPLNKQTNCFFDGQTKQNNLLNFKSH